MEISARFLNGRDRNDVSLRTNSRSHSIEIPQKDAGRGSDVNGGELLLLALATCYCNDVYREAAKRAIEIDSVEVIVDGEFGAEGEPAKRITYRARVESAASAEAIRELLVHTDTVAEIHNTLRASLPVTLLGTDG